MNLDLQTLTWAQAASVSTDALIVLVSEKAPKSAGVLSTMLAQAEKTGDYSKVHAYKQQQRNKGK